MFEQLRRSIEELLERATKPEERREVVARMRDTLVQAQLGMNDLRDALVFTRRSLEKERAELQTVRRRKELAASIPDAETVAVAERFERQHAERVAVLEGKAASQEQEMALAERELAAMKSDLRAAMSGADQFVQSPGQDPLAGETGSAAREELDAMARAQSRADREADAARKLEELKRKMGK